VAADSVILISNPDDQNDVKGRSGIIEKLRHDGFHAYTTKIKSNQSEKKI
jgi:hypothetical protein